MKEFKFRVWDKLEEKMHYIIGFVQIGEKVKYFIDKNKFQIRDADQIDIMQSTGLQDAHNKEIFEGDIVIFTEKKDVGNYLVSWKDESASFGFEYELIDTFALSWFEETLPRSDKWKIIGNKYEKENNDQ